MLNSYIYMRLHYLFSKEQFRVYIGRRHIYRLTIRPGLTGTVPV